MLFVQGEFRRRVVTWHRRLTLVEVISVEHVELRIVILDETQRNPAFRKLVSAALAARQGPDAVARIVDRRLAALEGARGYIDWQKRRAFALDLDATVSVILNELRPLDGEAALERLLRFLGGAESVFARVDDGAGTVQGVYDRAAEAAVEIGAALPSGTAARFASGLLPRVLADPTGALTVLLRGLPAPGWVRAVQRARLLQDGWLDEECLLWDSRGRLVAQARQLAGYRTG